MTDLNRCQAPECPATIEWWAQFCEPHARDHKLLVFGPEELANLHSAIDERIDFILDAIADFEKGGSVFGFDAEDIEPLRTQLTELEALDGKLRSES